MVVLKSLKPLKGDVNNDGNLNIMDVTALINYLLDDGESINLPAADVNSDGEINITDLTALIHLLLNRL